MITPTKGRIIFNSEVTDIGMLNQHPYIFQRLLKIILQCLMRFQMKKFYKL